ncbi:MAG: hypothetical protein J7518_05815 [Nocardioidaceae bacterium]|nr:hypothetical protein [Nocardioidaceae bacterium]
MLQFVRRRRGVAALVFVLSLAAVLAEVSLTTAQAVPVRQGAATVTPPPVYGRYAPQPGVRFNHWNDATRNYNKMHVLRTVQSVPPGGTIRWIIYSFGDRDILNALVAARKRGVSVQVLANFHNRETWAEWRALEKALGTRRVIAGKNPERISWARMCDKSCRGYGGHVHLKVFLFSQAKTSKYVTMFGSWNPTWVANQRQWNHLETSLDRDTYLGYLRVFAQAKLDRPFPYVQWASGSRLHMVFPKTGVTARTDPMFMDLGKVRCTGVTGNTGRGGRTVIRIAMYAWYGHRGDWMAKRVRSLWSQGCNVAIIYGIMSDRARLLLRSSSGRGPIPMRQATVPTVSAEPYRYLHDKYVALSGVWGDKTNATIVWAGSTNFSDLGFAADDSTARTVIAPIVYNYFRDWEQVWRGKNVHKPHPTVVTNPVGRSAQPSNQLPSELGEGIYRHLEAD